MFTAMTGPPLICDRARLERNRARARRQGAALFLHEMAAGEIQERLSEVNRRFTRAAVVTGFPEFWSEGLPGATAVDDAETLSLAPGAFDLIVHAMTLHWANDPVGQLVQCRRALEPDGLFLAVLPGGRTLHEVRASLAEAESRLAGGLSPRVLPMGEIRDLGALLMRAGFALPVADSVRLRASYRDLFHLAAELRAMGEGNALAARPGRRSGRTLFALAQDIYARAFPADGNRIAATWELIFLTGWAPGPGQPKPLRPGSALMRLSDALRSERADD
jgi:SAM-dependent methyltransferase